MSDKVIDIVKGKGRRIRMHLKKELMKVEPGLARGIPTKFLLLPALEVEWMKTWKKAGIKGGYLLQKKNLLALTVLHPPIHHIVRQIGLNELKTQGINEGMGAVARRVISEWERQGKPRPEPMQIGETLMIMENPKGPLILRTISGEKARRYLVTKVAKTKEIRWGELTIPATKPRTKKRGNTLQEIYSFRTR